MRPRRRIDLIVIASPNKTHVPLATAALEAGLPVVVDKPVAGTAAEARGLAALAAGRGLLLSVFQNRRWDNDCRTLRKLLADGELGLVWRFESRFERWRPQPKGGWRESGDPAEIGGLLYDLGSHVVDQRWPSVGYPYVYAEADVRRAGAETDDDTFIALTHASGVRSHLYVSATTAQLGPRFRVLGSRAGYVKYGLDPQEAALREGRRPGNGEDWGVEPESLWGRVGSGESPVTGGGLRSDAAGRLPRLLRGDRPAGGWSQPGDRAGGGRRPRRTGSGPPFGPSERFRRRHEVMAQAGSTSPASGVSSNRRATIGLPPSDTSSASPRSGEDARQLFPRSSGAEMPTTTASRPPNGFQDAARARCRSARPRCPPPSGRRPARPVAGRRSRAWSW
ncbi:Inositol 2-dehydrogenase/D-chiro-inositol 3-dehydrogenase [Streptomyces glaucescens]